MKVRFLTAVDTDIGISKSTNQDSVIVKHAAYEGGEVLMAIVCDGMGGLSKGELASAVVVQAFSKWFNESLPYELTDVHMDVIGGKWSLMLKDLNIRIAEYGNRMGVRLGTTFSGILFVKDQYVIVHVGDSRVYHIDSSVKLLTTDHTFVAREVNRGTMTLDQAKIDKRRNLLLQCVGASDVVTPEVLCGNTKKGIYMLCTDGFRHEITEAEMYESLNPIYQTNKQTMQDNARYLIDQVKSRNERDNISVVLIKTE